MSDIEIGSEWIDKSNDKIVATVTRLMPENKALQYKTSTGWTTSSVAWFLEDFKPMEVEQDMVNHPPHYKDASGVGCTEVVKHMMYFGGACFKYLYRCGNKWDDVEDLKKAVRCAELADDDRFITDESWLRAMYQVASHRDGNIRDAMFNIRSQQWEYVIEYIKAEIARLESE